MQRMPLYELALTVPWCITPDALEMMLVRATHHTFTEEEQVEVARRMHGPRAPEALAFRERTKRDDSQRMRLLDGVAILAIDGPIFRYADLFTDMSGGVTTEALARDVQRAMDDPSVQALLLVIDSPGGEATGINELADMIYQHRATKPIGAYGDGIVASAALWIASAAEIVGIDASAWIGSIGTIIGVPDPTKRPSTTIQFVSEDAPKKRPDPTTEAGRAYLQGLANRSNAVFVEAMMRNRGMSREAVVALEGGLLVGREAVDAGLADRLASEEEMIQLLRERAQQRRERALGLTSATQIHTERTAGMPGDAKGFWSAFWSGAKEQGLLDTPSPAVAQIAQDANTPAPDGTQLAEIARLRQQLEASHQAEATTFVDGLITGSQLLPKDRDAVHALYLQAAADDLAHGPITLASGQTTRVALVKASQQGRATHDLTKEQLDPKQDAQQILTNRQHTQTGEEAELDVVEQSARAYAARTNGVKRS